MPNIKSAAKRDALSKAQNAANKARKSEMKTVIKKFDAKAEEGDTLNGEHDAQLEKALELLKKQ